MRWMCVRVVIAATIFALSGFLNGCGGGTSGGPQPPKSPTPPTSGELRTRYTRTDSVTEYGFELNANWMVYDPPTKRYFVSDPDGNRIVVMDSTTEKEIGFIAVPGAFGIDEAPDHSVIYAGTQIGDLYAVDPVGMTVKRRYQASQVGTNGYHAYSARVLANGKVVLLGGQGGIPGVDGYSSIAVWSPGDNSLTEVYGDTIPACTSNYFILTNIGAFTLTGDRSLIVIGSIDSDATLCTIDPNTGAKTAVSSGANFLYKLTPTPDGKSLLVPIYGDNGGEIAVFDSKTLAQTKMFNVAGDTSSAASMIVSPDSKTLYMGSSGGILYAYDIASGMQAGWMPNPVLEPTSGGGNVGASGGPNLGAFDGTGLLAGPMEEGVGFIDTKALRTGPVGTGFQNAYVSPATGPAAGGTQVQWAGSSNAPTITAVYFGAHPATALSGGAGQFYATTPAGNPGPADLYALMQDGGMQIVPEAFSYGPTILEVTPNVATAEGGGTGVVYGYGLGPTTYGSTVPSDLQITVGGKSAPVTGYAPNAYGLGSPPFLLQAAAFTIPAGSAGGSADLAVTTQSGTATATSAVKYLPKVQQFALPGALLAQGVYDAKRDLYYFTDASQIQVFSRSQEAWLSPIQVPAAPSGTTHRLWGIAISPNDSKLAVSDTNAGLLYLIDPDAPGSAQSFPVTTYFSGSPITLSGQETFPAGVAISDAGAIYFAAYEVGGDGLDGYFKLDTATGTVTDYSIVTFGGTLLRTVIASDNSRVYFNNQGQVSTIDTATNQVSYATDNPSCCYGRPLGLE